MALGKKYLLLSILFAFLYSLFSPFSIFSEENKKKPVRISEKTSIALEKIAIRSPVRLLEILEENHYSGEPVNFIFQNGDIRDIIRDISQMIGFEIEIAPEIQGRITCNLKQIPWNQALSIFLKDNNLKIIYDGKILKIQKKEESPSFTPFFLIFIVLLILTSGAFAFIYYKRKSIKIKPEKCFTINPGKAEEFAKRITYLLEIEKIYRDENLSLHSLAEKLSIPYYVVSKIINERLKRTFSDLINYHRVEEAKKWLENPEESQTKILNIAYDVGFGTKTAFNRTFKKYTQMTPSQYRKKINS